MKFFENVFLQFKFVHTFCFLTIEPTFHCKAHYQ